MAIAPWISPPSYLEAMRAGAGLGLAAAAQDISGEESADRLRLAYSQMAQQERQQQRQLEAAQHYRAAQQLLRQGQMDALARYRQQMEADRAQRANLAERQFQAMDLYRQQQAKALEAYRAGTLADRMRRESERPIARLTGPAAGDDAVLAQEEEDIKAQLKEARSNAALDPEAGKRAAELLPKLADLAQRRSVLHERMAPQATEQYQPGLLNPLPEGTAPAPMTARRVRVKSPSGKVGTIPESQLDAALAAGYTKADSNATD